MTADFNLVANIGIGMLFFGTIVMLFAILTEKLSAMITGGVLMIVGLFAVILASVAGAEQRSNECELMGGVLLQTDTVTVCIDLDSILNPEDQNR